MQIEQLVQEREEMNKLAAIFGALVGIALLAYFAPLFIAKPQKEGRWDLFLRNPAIIANDGKAVGQRSPL